MSAVNGINNIQNNYDSVAEAATKRASEGLDPEKLSSGQTISGKLVGMSGNTASIDIGGTIITARLEGNMNLNIGESLTFTLRSLNDNQITLSPLFTNMNQQEMASKALIGAGLPVNNENLQIAGKMMDAGMSIDSKSMNDMVRLSNAYPGENISTFSEMQKFGLDINANTIEKFSAFKNYEAQISDGMNNIMNGITDTYRQMLAVGADVEGAQFLKGVIQTFTPAGSADGVSQVSVNPNEVNAQTVDVGTPIKVMANTDVQGLGDNGESLIREKQVISEERLLLRGEDLTKNVDELMDIAKQENIRATQNYDVTVRQPGMESAKVNVEVNTKVADAWQVLNNTDKSAMVDMLKQSGLGENEARFLLSEDATQQDFLRATSDLMKDGVFTDAIREMVQTEGFENILKSQMKAQWTLAPIDVDSKENVEQLYDRLQYQIKEITESISKLNVPNNELSQNLSDMNQNLDFMQQMNNVMQYVQLPLRMSGAETTGDLYVYANKRGREKDDGSVSALLHLDMENLGPLDVYASITPGNNVYTKFYLQDEATIDFISDNIHILNERLEKRGYTMKSEIVEQKKGGSITPGESAPAMPRASDNLTPDGRLIRKYSFDAFA